MAGCRPSRGPRRGRNGRPDAEEVIHRLASRQHGVVSRGQLVEAGLPKGVLDRLVTAGRLRPVHRGVYRVGPVVAPRSLEMAAVLACGSSSAVSHWSAAFMCWRLPDDSRPSPVHVTVWRGRRAHGGILVHRSRLARDEVRRIEGIAVTTPARTLLDLAGYAGSRELERAVAEALARRLVGPRQVLELLDRYPRRSGSRQLRSLICGADGPVLTRSEAEELFLTLVRKAELPTPEVNVEVAGFEVDFLWRTHGLVVEIDGYAFHSSRDQFERDRRRDGVLVRSGFRVMRVTWGQLVHESAPLLGRLGMALGSMSSR